jgi:hypothetical protein
MASQGWKGLNYCGGSCRSLGRSLRFKLAECCTGNVRTSWYFVSYFIGVVYIRTLSVTASLRGILTAITEETSPEIAVVTLLWCAVWWCFDWETQRYGSIPVPVASNKNELRCNRVIQDLIVGPWFVRLLWNGLNYTAIWNVCSDTQRIKLWKCPFRRCSFCVHMCSLLTDLKPLTECS